MCIAGEDGFLARRIAKQAWPLLEQLVRTGKFSAGAISGGDSTEKPSLSPGRGLLPDLPARQLLQIDTLGTASDRDLLVPASQSKVPILYIYIRLVSSRLKSFSSSSCFFD